MIPNSKLRDKELSVPNTVAVAVALGPPEGSTTHAWHWSHGLYVTSADPVTRPVVSEDE